MSTFPPGAAPRDPALTLETGQTVKVTRRVRASCWPIRPT